MRNETGARAKNQLNDDPGAISVDCELSFSIAHFEVGETAIAKKVLPKACWDGFARLLN